MIHTFHIPVMGLAFTIDTPIKVAHLGITSVVSIGDDILIEKVRNFYSEKYSIPVQPVNRHDKDARSMVITSYLNMMDDLVQKNWKMHINHLILDKKYREEFFLLLPDTQYWQNEWERRSANLSSEELILWAEAEFRPGSIDVNIMTKLDNMNSLRGKDLPVEYNNAHASLRGYAMSRLSSSIVLSAGMNMPLMGYMQTFEDFLPDAAGYIKKKIIIKVSDFRSASIQGKLFAKKGLWVSEFRIESGLNCGGHAFPTQGHLMGPILEEFRAKRNQLRDELFLIWRSALKREDLETPEIKISAQGGLGTNAEHEFLREYYGVDSVGWGSPFLLVPEAVTIDDETLQKLSSAKEEDLYLSNASPLGVPFNNLRNSGRQIFQKRRSESGRFGNPCTKKFLKMNSEFGEPAICTASSQYINQSIAKLEKSGITKEALTLEKERLLEKECLCCGLAMPFSEAHHLDKKLEGKGVSVCPGPNIAYFEGIFSLREMVMHIYGKKNLITRTDRPNLFVKEIGLYMDFLSGKISSLLAEPNDKARNYIHEFIENMSSGLAYYKDLFAKEFFMLSSIQDIRSLEEFILLLENRKSILVTIPVKG
jgi:hypothetical protein